MQAGSVVGRVGTLTLALAVGIVLGGGVASASEGSDDTGSSSQSSSQSTGGSQTAGGSDSTDSADKTDNAGDDSDAADTKSGTEDTRDTQDDTDTDTDDSGGDDTEEAADDPAGDAESDAGDSPSESADTTDDPAAEDPAEISEEAAEPSEVASTTEPEPTGAVETDAPETTTESVPDSTSEEQPETSETSETSMEADTTDATTVTEQQNSEATEETAAAQDAEETSSVSADTSEAADVETVSLQTVAGTVDSTQDADTATDSADVTAAAATTDTEPMPFLRGVITAVATVVDYVITTVLGWVGITPSASGWTANNPFAAAVISFLGLGARRETEDETSSLVGVTVTSELDLASLAALTGLSTIQVAWLTGEDSINETLTRFGIYGTDLGIMWDNGITGDDPTTSIVEQHQILIVFGDTFSNAAMTAGWRNNVLLRTADNVLSDGISIPDGIPDLVGIPIGAYSGSPMDPGVADYARQIIGKYPYTWWTQVTIIPTGAISVEGAGVDGATRQYVSIMSVNQWGWPGSWRTNYSAIAYSDDNGQNWTVVPKSSVRSAGWLSSTVAYQWGGEKFQMVSFVKPPEGSADAEAGYIYAYGTPSGRNGTVYLSRVQESDILDVSKYEYWTGSSWVTNAMWLAKPVLPGTKNSFLGLFSWTTYPTAGELSVQYNEYLDKYVMLSTDSSNNVVLRTADEPWGTWSSPVTLVTSAQYPGLYAPMIHPWSGTDLLLKSDGSTEDPQYLYWNMSLWGDYNVTLMRTDLSSLLTTV